MFRDIVIWPMHITVLLISNEIMNLVSNKRKRRLQKTLLRESRDLFTYAVLQSIISNHVNHYFPLETRRYQKSLHPKKTSKTNFFIKVLIFSDVCGVLYNNSSKITMYCEGWLLRQITERPSKTFTQNRRKKLRCGSIRDRPCI